MPEPNLTNLRLDRPGIRAALGDLEADIMEVVWSRPSDEGVTVRAVWEAIHPKRSIMYTTVMNTMTRLARKQLLVTERKGLAYVYRPTLDRDAFVDRFVAGALERLLTNFSGATRDRLSQVTDPALQDRIAKLVGDIERRRNAEEPD